MSFFRNPLNPGLLLFFFAVFIFLCGVSSNYLILDKLYSPSTWPEFLSIYVVSLVVALTLLVSAFNLLFRFTQKWQIGVSTLAILILYSVGYPIYTLIMILMSEDHKQADILGVLVGTSIIETPFLSVLGIYLCTYYEEVVFKLLGDY